MVEFVRMSTSERTLVVIKPDGVQRTLVGEIIRRFERVGLKMVGLKLTVADTDTITNHYLADPLWREKLGEKLLQKRKDAGKDISNDTPFSLGDAVLKNLCRFMTAGPVVALALEGAGAVPLTRKLVGDTEPLSSDVGTIRGDFVLDSYTLSDTANRAIRNIIHASSSTEDAQREIALWFSPEELFSYETAHEKILYDVNFDNVSE